MITIMQKVVKFAICFLTLMSFSTSAYSENVNKHDPYEMIQEVAQITFDRFAREESNIKENPELLKVIVREELMPYIFYQYAGLKVLGNYRKKASKEEIQAFLLAFREYLVTSYAQVFTLYNKQAIIFEPEKEIGKQKIIMIGIDIVEKNDHRINIKFKIRKNSKTNEWQAFDLVAEGISLLDAKTKELRSILAENGVPKVTAMLLEKSQRKIVFKKDDSVDAKLKEQQGE